MAQLRLTIDTTFKIWFLSTSLDAFVTRKVGAAAGYPSGNDTKTPAVTLDLPLPSDFPAQLNLSSPRSNSTYNEEKHS